MLFAQSDEEIVEQFSGLGWQDWLLASAILVAAIVAARLLGTGIRKAVGRTAASQYIAVVLGRLVAAVVTIIGFSLALQAIGVSIGPLIGALGIAGLALAFALQDILENVIAGLLMIIRRPLAIGDEVATNDYQGRVTDITLRAVELTTFDGETVFIPNAMVWKNPVTNITSTPDRRTRLDVGVAYGADIDAAKVLLEHAASLVDGVHPDPAPAAFVHQFGESSVDFAVFFWHDAHIATQWWVRDEVARSIKRTLDAAGVAIPFPQRVIHMAPESGSSD